jgi:hypothetical protein
LEPFQSSLKNFGFGFAIPFADDTKVRCSLADKELNLEVQVAHNLPLRRTQIMPVQMEFPTKSFDQLFEMFRKATESTLEMQQNLFRQWTATWPGTFPSSLPKFQPSGVEQFQQFCKDWTQATTEMTRKNMEICESQYKAGLELLEAAFKPGEDKDPAKQGQKMTELWQRSFECFKNLAVMQMKNFQFAIEKWMELVKKATP